MNKPTALEKVLVLYFRDGTVKLNLIPIEVLWAYVRHAYRTGEDPDDIMRIEQNLYAIGRAELFGMAKERNEKYGR